MAANRAISVISPSDRYKREKKISHNKKMEAVAMGVDALDLGGIFVLSVDTLLAQFLQSMAKYFLFPVAALMGILRSILAWRQVALERGKQSGTIVAALVETIAALGITTAVVGGLLFSWIFQNFPPMIFAGVMGFKAIYNAISSIYYWGKSSGTDDSTQEYKLKAIGHAISAVVNVLATAAVTLVMIVMAKPLFAVLGIAAGTIGVGYAIYKVCTTPALPTPPVNENAMDVEITQEPVKQIRNTRDVYNSLNDTLRDEEPKLTKATQPSTYFKANNHQKRGFWFCSPPKKRDIFEEKGARNRCGCF